MKKLNLLAYLILSFSMFSCTEIDLENLKDEISKNLASGPVTCQLPPSATGNGYYSTAQGQDGNCFYDRAASESVTYTPNLKSFSSVDSCSFRELEAIGFPVEYTITVDYSGHEPECTLTDDLGLGATL